MHRYAHQPVVGCLHLDRLAIDRGGPAVLVGLADRERLILGGVERGCNPSVLVRRERKTGGIDARQLIFQDLQVHGAGLHQLGGGNIPERGLRVGHGTVLETELIKLLGQRLDGHLHGLPGAPPAQVHLVARPAPADGLHERAVGPHLAHDAAFVIQVVHERRRRVQVHRAVSRRGQRERARILIAVAFLHVDGGKRAHVIAGGVCEHGVLVVKRAPLLPVNVRAARGSPAKRQRQIVAVCAPRGAQHGLFGLGRGRRLIVHDVGDAEQRVGNDVGAHVIGAERRDLAIAQVVQQLLDAVFLRGRIMVERAHAQHERHIVRSVDLAAAPIRRGVAHAGEGGNAVRRARGLAVKLAVEALQLRERVGVAADRVAASRKLRLRAEHLFADEHADQRDAQRGTQGRPRVLAIRPRNNAARPGGRRDQQRERRQQPAFQRHQLGRLRQASLHHI